MSLVRFRTNLAAPLSLLLLSSFLPARALGHTMHHRSVEGDAVTVEFYLPGGEKPWFEPYTVMAPGTDSPFQTGRVNAAGRVSFIPDRGGEWTVRVITEDGHGTVATVLVDQAGAVVAVGGSHGHAGRVVAALGYLLGLFGFVALWWSRRSRAGGAVDGAHS